MATDIPLPTRIAEILSPHLGSMTADSVARHLCAKHGVSEGAIDATQARELRETIRRGLVAFVGQELARDLSKRCFTHIEGLE